jgi:trafficking protein particle complex subunit 2
MSYYFVIISPTDKPLFELTFGTFKAGGDGIARFRNGETSRYMNQFIVHASIDVVEEVQWLSPNMWLKVIDNYAPTSSHVSCFITGSNVRFMLLHQPAAMAGAAAGSRSSTMSSTSIPHNPTSPQTEEAIRQFMTEVYELWVKASMNPFYRLNNTITSPVFRQRITAAGRKWL